MPGFNRVLLLGNLTRDPILKTLPTQTQVCEFGLAVNRKFRTPAGENRVDTVFVDCAAFGKIADTIVHYCQKGRPLFVEGRLRYDSWEDKAGAKRSKLSVVVENFQFVGSRDRANQTAPPPGKGDPQRLQTRRPEPVSVKQDDVPF